MPTSPPPAVLPAHVRRLLDDQARKSRASVGGHDPIAHLFARDVQARLQPLQRLSFDTDEKLLMLPHPARLDYMRHLEISQVMYGPEWPTASAIMADNRISLFKSVNDLARESQTFKYLFNMGAVAGTGTNGGNADTLLLSTRYALGGGRLFQTTDTLDEWLRNSDIADSLPVSVLRPPFPICYFEFGQSRTSPFRVYNPESGPHVAEGCYVFEQHLPASDLVPYPHRSLVIMSTGKPKANISDDATGIYNVQLLDENLSVGETVKNFVRLHRLDIAQAAARGGTPDLRVASDVEMQALEDILQHLLKIILYLSTAKAVKTDHAERTQLLKSLSGSKSGGKRAKAERKVARAYDRIVIGPKEAPRGNPVTAAGRQVMTHWRRGHFRDQRHGEGLKLVKTIFIEPQLIAADSLAEGMLAKTYEIR